MTPEQVKTHILSAPTPAALISRAKYRFGLSPSSWPSWVKEAAAKMRNPIKRMKKKRLSSREKEFRLSEREVIKARMERDGVLYCEVCGKPIMEEPQMGHRISQSAENLKSLTPWFIHSAENQRGCCSLECNHAAAVSSQTHEYWELFGDIIRYLRMHPVVPRNVTVVDPTTKLEVPIS